MENNINEALGLNKPDSSNDQQNSATTASAENTLSIIANILLWVGILGAFVIVAVMTDKDQLGGLGIVAAIATLISSIITWGVLKVICNISESLKEINNKMK